MISNSDNFQFWDLHLHNLISRGVYLPGQNPYYSDLRKDRIKRFRRFNFKFAGYRYDTIYRYEHDTPYSFKKDYLFYRGDILSNLPISKLEPADDYWGSENNWWFKKIDDLPEFYDLRLNPINACANLIYKSGENEEMRGCVFCQRCYSNARISESRRAVSPKKIFDEIFSIYGPKILEKVTKVILITGDTRTELEMLRLASDIHSSYLCKNHFSGTFSVVTTIIQSSQGITNLSKLDDRLFEFPIECFDRRELILGQRKGIPLDRVVEILKIARNKFRHIRVNYLVGLDDPESARRGFGILASNNLVDDVVSNIFVPYTETALKYRLTESLEIEYLYEIRDIIRGFGFSPKKTGTTKDAFSHFEKTILEDELVKTVNR